MSKLANRDSLYGRRWREARRAHLSQHPLCVFCRQRGVLTAASVVDHDPPHRGDPGCFWDSETWQSLCSTCHNSTKQAMERTGKAKGCGVDGWPLPPPRKSRLTA